MKLLLLGTAGYHPNDRRQTACLMLPEVGVVLDAGTGFYRVREHLCTPRLDIFLTHAHLDHVVGLTYLLNVVRDRIRDVAVYATADKLATIRGHLLASALFPAPLPCAFRPLEGPVRLADGGTLRHFPVEHPGGAVGFRLDWPGHSLAYVTDTTAAPGAPYVEAVRGVDLLAHECNFADADSQLAAMWGHSSASNVAELARAADVRRLLLVHLDPMGDDAAKLQQASSIFTDSVLGEDGLALDF
jgi:ribonuclease Z